MANDYFDFKQFRISQKRAPMKVCTDACILGAVASHENPARILDIGAGAGLLSLMLAQRYNNAAIDAVECNPLAIADAQQNFENSPWKDRIVLQRQRIQDFQPSAKYDLIVCNPPFFTRHQKSSDSGKNQALHNDDLPHSDLVKVALRLLAPAGAFTILLPPYESDQFHRMARHAGLHATTRLKIRNFPRKPVFREIVSYAFNEQTSTESELIIRNTPADYTAEFRRALAPYYLYL